ncbi:pyridoxal 5'-phosphate synthase [Streptomyces sp. 8P21H-1]|uniref:pyridoxine/pyridoxamine 5'-phosphate oxidase n=1 Tax=Streptomyces sp. 8P21H-1 TaxID=2737048 RepID=UPI00156E0C68|nr:pyridoxal 5'-phosphate synthase [Streptomyces sp. 8P21H-1]NSL43067.1 pyridoxamine 5'-phosphate oxidase [Streptomyces sp. 8P21H-1]
MSVEQQSPTVREVLRSLDVFAGPLPRFSPREAPDSPQELFVEWLTEAVAAGVREPHAMTLSTAGQDGTPSARVLLLKDVGPAGWSFAAHAASPKGRDLAATPAAALTFYWPQQARQVRLRGAVAPGSPELSAQDFLARPLGSRAEALAGMQSRPLDDPGSVSAATEEALARLGHEPDLVVPEWTLYTLAPRSVEFWQGDKQRKHTRLVYLRSAEGWDKQLLWP